MYVINYFTMVTIQGKPRLFTHPPCLSVFILIHISIHDVHVLYSWGTDVLLLALRRVPKLDTNSAVIIGTGEHSCKMMLKPI